MMTRSELYKLDRLEQAEEVDLRAWMEEFTHAYSTLSPEKRAYSMIRAFFKIEKPSDREYRMFIGWLMNGNITKAKYEALGRVFEEMCECNTNIE